MKKRIILVAVLLAVFVLSGCVNKEAVSRVELLIDGIGAVDLNSEASIAAAEDAYAQLSEEDRAAVGNHQRLLDARAAYEEACRAEAERLRAEEEAQRIRDAMLPYAGDWTNTEIIISSITGTEAPGVSWLTLNEDGSARLSNGEEGNWELNAAGDSVLIRVDGRKNNASLFDEDGFTLLSYGKKTWVRSEDRIEYQRRLKEMFVFVTVTDSNFRDYIGEPYRLGQVKNTDLSDWHLYYWINASKAYEDGLVYVSCANFSILREESMVNFGTRIYDKKTSHEPFVMTCSWGHGGMLTPDMDLQITLCDSASGRLVFVRQEFVEKNYINSQGYRTLELRGGYTIVDKTNDWDNVGANYALHPY